MNVKSWLCLNGFLDLFAVSMVSPLVPLYLRDIGKSPSFIGIYSSLYGMVQLVSSPMIGHWSDKHGRINVLLSCLIVTGCAYAACAIVLDVLILLAFTRIILGLFKHTQDMCRILLAANTDINTKTKVISQFNAISTIGFILGPAISGKLSAYIGLKTAVITGFLLCSSVYIIIAVFINYFVRPLCRFNKNNTKVSKLQRDKDFFLTIKELNWKEHGWMFFSRFVLALAVMVYRSSFVLGVKHIFPFLTTLEIGYLTSYIAFIGSLIGYFSSFLYSHPYYAEKEKQLQFHAHCVISVSLFIISLTRSVPLLMFGLALLALGTSASKACGVSLTIKCCGQDEAGKFLGLNASFVSLARSVAPIFSGFVQEYSFLAPAYLALVLSLFSLTLFFITVYLQPFHAKED